MGTFGPIPTLIWSLRLTTGAFGSIPTPIWSFVLDHGHFWLDPNANMVFALDHGLFWLDPNAKMVFCAWPWALSARSRRQYGLLSSAMGTFGLIPTLKWSFALGHGHFRPDPDANMVFCA
ncbi:hypothetical protein ACFO4N_06975 [Camelliibacillus cellulosilyticus]|uniref:Uncharacterized protein n=2 Tax=Camelliibacillus cellulosilyticus TaxID=2174486 RepID=A0ABV9GPB3_9BACL